MGLFGISGGTWKKIGGYALKAAPYIAAPFTGGLSIPIGMALQGGIGAAQGAMGGGGLKGALLGGGIGAGLGAIPGGAAASGVVKNLVKPAITTVGSGLMSKLASGGAPPSTPEGNVYSNTLPQNNFSTPQGLSFDGAPGAAPDDGSPGFGEKYGPLISQGIGLGAGILAGKAATSSAAARSPEEAAALARSNAAAAGLGQAGNTMLTESRPYITQPAGYYRKLLTGDRSTMQQATAGQRAQLQEQGRGAEASLARSGIRGAARDVIGGQLRRDTAGKVSALTTGVQPWAANQLAQLGTSQQQLAGPLLTSSANVYGNLLGEGYKNRVYSRQEGEKTGKSIGQLASMAGTIPWGKKKPAVPGAPGQQPQAPTVYDPSQYETVGPPLPPPTFTDTGDYGDAANY